MLDHTFVLTRIEKNNKSNILKNMQIENQPFKLIIKCITFTLLTKFSFKKRNHVKTTAGKVAINIINSR